jgi:hypothetical protein
MSGGKGRHFCFGKLARLAELLMESFFEGKCTLIEELQREEDVNVVVEYSDMKSKIDLKPELAEAIWISKAKPKPGQADKIFSSLRKQVSLYEATCTLTPNLKLLLDTLLTTRPTSTQNERHFYTSGIFVAKQR